MDLQSQPASGKSFTVRLPLRPDLAGNDDAPGECVSSTLGKTPEQSLKAPKAPPQGSGPRKAPGSWLGPEGQALAVQALPTRLADTVVETHATKAAVALAPATAALADAPAQTATVPSVPQLVPFLVGQMKCDRPKVIMSVDDDHVNQEVMRSVLEPVGFKIVVCMNGFECLEYMDNTDRTIMPDLILLDLMMPGINGFDVLQAQRKIYTQEQMPIIIVSAKNQVSSVVKGLELGCNDWIHKPFDRQELIARVKTQLKMKHTNLGFQLLATTRGQPQQPAEAGSVAPVRRPPALLPVDQLQETATLCAMLTDRRNGHYFHILPELFAVFETLCEQHGIIRTEMLGSLFVAVGRAMDGTQGFEIVDRMLRLAFAMAEAVEQVNRDAMLQGALTYSMAIHYDAHGPPIIDGRKGGRPRQYPMSSLFGTTVHGANCLCMATQLVCGILLSTNACSRLSDDIKSELRDRGLKVETVPMSAAVALGSMNSSSFEAALGSEFYALVTANGSQPPSSRATTHDALAEGEAVGTSATAVGAHLPGHGKPPLDSRRMQLELQQELWKAKQDIKAYINRMSTAEKESQMMEQQVSGYQSEVRSLRAQLEEVSSGKDNKARQNYTPLSETFGSLPNLPRHVSMYQVTSGSLPTMEAGVNEDANVVPQGACGRFDANTRGPNGNVGTPQNHGASSLLFLQWQNARLQAEVRYLQDSLAAAKGQVLMHVTRSQAMERRQLMLQERVDHLELDLVLHSTHGDVKVLQGFRGALPSPMPGVSASSCGGGAGTLPAKASGLGAGMMGLGCGVMGGPMGHSLPPNFASHQFNEVMGATMPGMGGPGMGVFGMPFAGSAFGCVPPLDPQGAAGSAPSI